MQEKESNTGPQSPWLSRTHLACLLLAIAMAPLLAKHLWGMAKQPMWWFTPIAFACFSFRVWRVPKIGFSPVGSRRQAGVNLLIASCAAGLISAIFISPTIAYLALLLLLLGWTLLCLGIIPWTRIIAYSSLLWATWNFPANLAQRATAWINRQCQSTAAYILDSLEVPNYLDRTRQTLDLQGSRLEFTSLFNSVDSLSLLVFLTLTTLLITRHSLLKGSAALLFCPIASWLGGTVFILLLCLGSEFYQSDWTAGWQLGLLVAVRITFEMLVVGCFLYGFTYFVEPMPMQEGEKGFQALFNRIVVWPAVPTSEANQSDAYYEDDANDPSQQDAAYVPVVPSRRATKAASDPLIDRPRLAIVLPVLAGLTLVLASIAAWPRPERPQPLGISQEMQAELVDGTTIPSKLGELTRTASNPPAESEGVRVYSWNYDSGRANGTYSLKYPVVGFSPSIEFEDWEVATTPRFIEFDGLPIYEADIVNARGETGTYFITAFDDEGQSYVNGNSIVAKLARRFSKTVFGRMAGTDIRPNTHQILFLIEERSTLSEASKRRIREEFVQSVSDLLASSRAGAPINRAVAP